MAGSPASSAKEQNAQKACQKTNTASRQFAVIAAVAAITYAGLRPPTFITIPGRQDE